MATKVSIILAMKPAPGGGATFPRSRHIAAGVPAGVLAGLVFAAAMQEQRMSVPVTGIAGLSSTGPGLLLHLTLAGLLGAAFAVTNRYEASGHSATMSAGVLFGFLAWIIGPLTLKALFDGESPTWSLTAATNAFPSLVGHMLFGGALGLGLHLIASLDRRLNPGLLGLLPDERKPTRVLILGSGFGGLATAQRLERLHLRNPNIEISLVSQSNYLLFTPMLAEVASSGLEAQHISAPIRAATPRTRFFHAEIESIEPQSKQVRLRVGISGSATLIAYDQLVLALGSVPNFYGLPGLEANAFTLKSLDDAVTLRNRVLISLEQADVESDPEVRQRLCTFVVVGGGFAGAEMIAELVDLVRSVGKYYPNLGSGDVRFVLVHSGERILQELGSELGEYAQRKLEARGVEIILQRRVASATSEAITLDDGRELLTRTLVWTAGNQPNPLLGPLEAEKNRGQVVVDGALRVSGLEDVWAIGDCAQVPDPSEEGRFYPPTAQHALREGTLVAENITAAFRGQPAKNFSFRPIGSLVGLGHRTAAAEIRGWRFSGLLAWLLWRSIYLGKLPGMERKVRVGLDWLLDLFFPRDIVLTSTPEPPGAQTERDSTSKAETAQRDAKPASRDLEQ